MQLKCDNGVNQGTDKNNAATKTRLAATNSAIAQTTHYLSRTFYAIWGPLKQSLADKLKKRNKDDSMVKVNGKY